MNWKSMPTYKLAEMRRIAKLHPQGDFKGLYAELKRRGVVGHRETRGANHGRRTRRAMR